MAEIPTEIIDSLIKLATAGASIVGLTKLGAFAKEVGAILIEPAKNRRLKAVEREHELESSKNQIEIAKNQVETELIKAVGEIQNELVLNGIRERFITQETIKQNYIKDVFEATPKYINESVSEEPLSEKFKFQFTKALQDSCDADLKEVWAKILAGEINKPGSFSVRTLSALTLMDKKDAELFTKLCSFAIRTPKPILFIFYYDGQNDFLTPHPSLKFYEAHDLYYSDLIHLESIGLVTFDKNKSTYFSFDDELINVKYFDEEFTISLKHSGRNLSIGNVVLTKIGEELANICQSEKIEGFIEFSKPIWQAKHCVVLK